MTKKPKPTFTKTADGGIVPYPVDTQLPKTEIKTQSKSSSKKTARKKPSPKPKNIVKEITTVEEKSNDGYWTKIIRVRYIKQLLCPGFFSDNVVMCLAAIPFIIFIGIILWKVFSHE